MPEQTTFGFCEDGFHVRMLSVVRHYDPAGNPVGACASCLHESGRDDPETLWETLVERAKRAVAAAL